MKKVYAVKYMDFWCKITTRIIREGEFSMPIKIDIHGQCGMLITRKHIRGAQYT